MLIEFSVKNFLSFKELSTFSMVADAKKDNKLDNTHIIQVNEKLRLLKSALIYGDNASGKSNLFKAFGYMQGKVQSSYRDALMSYNTYPLTKFALNTQSANEPSFFEIVFIQDGIRYRYGFEMDYEKVVSEWLFHTAGKKEVYLFKREAETFSINQESFQEGVGKDKETKSNVLFLSKLATDNKEIASRVFDWFKKMGRTSGVVDNNYNRYTLQKLKSDEKFLEWVSLFAKYLEISNVSIVETEAPAIEVKIKEDKETKKIDTQGVNRVVNKQLKIKTLHRRYDKNNTLTDTITFDIMQESDGTKKLIYLLGPWYDTLINGKVLIIDELDSRLHGILTKRLINFFHKMNRNNAQLIGIVHDTSLLNKELFRRDQIWFTEKNQFGASDVFSLSDFKTNVVRKTSDYEKMYLDGKFGGVPCFPDIDSNLSDIMYGKD